MSAHVVPVWDRIIHELSDSCACGPRPELLGTFDGGEWIMVHHSLDGTRCGESVGSPIMTDQTPDTSTPVSTQDVVDQWTALLNQTHPHELAVAGALALFYDFVLDRMRVNPTVVRRVPREGRATALGRVVSPLEHEVLDWITRQLAERGPMTVGDLARNADSAKRSMVKNLMLDAGRLGISAYDPTTRRHYPLDWKPGDTPMSDGSTP